MSLDCFITKCSDTELIINIFQKLMIYSLPCILIVEGFSMKIEEGFSFEEGMLHFKRIPECFLDTLFTCGCNVFKYSYSELTQKFEWITKHDPGNNPCDNNFSMERYILSIMNFAPTTNGRINNERHFMWPGISCKKGSGSVTSIDLTEKSLSGSINTEIGLFINLERLMLRGNTLTGSILTEIGSLTALEILWLGE